MSKPKSVKKAIIPAAGLGTRFLPATKSLPKEMLPIIDIPTIQIIVEEAAKSGIEEILIITSGAKSAIENHFDINFELEERLRSSHKDASAQQIRDIAGMANIHYIRQKEPKGLGDAILCAKTFVNDEPFAVLLGDDIVYNNKGDKPATQQLIDAYKKMQASILGVQKVAKDDVSKYGIVDPEGAKDFTLATIQGIVEKPDAKKAPSEYAVLGRYVLTPTIFDILKDQKPGKGDEVQLTDAIETLLKKEKVYACNFTGNRFDVGDKLGYLKANVEYALRRDELSKEFKEYLKSLNL